MARILSILSILILKTSWACVGCGQESYSPKMLLVGSFFALLPMGLAAGIAWILLKDSKKKDVDPK